MATAPIIGLNADVEKRDLRLRRAYVAAVRRAGGIPLILPPVRGRAAIMSQLRAIDGLLLTGGDDYRPSRYGARGSPEVTLCMREREEYDHALCVAALGIGLPIFGICGGLQLVTICLGGTLTVHVDGHRACHHGVTVEHGTGLRRIIGAARLRVNSSHHQVANGLGRRLRPAARGTDGCIEAIEGTGDRFLLAVQWHPERMHARSAVRLFAAFTRAARRWKNVRTDVHVR